MEYIDSDLLYAEPVCIVDENFHLGAANLCPGISLSRGTQPETIIFPTFQGVIMGLSAIRSSEDDAVTLKVITTDCKLLEELPDRYLSAGKDPDKIYDLIVWTANQLSKFISKNIVIGSDINEDFAYELVDCIYVISRLLVSFPTSLYADIMQFIGDAPTAAILRGSRYIDETEEETPRTPDEIQYERFVGNSFPGDSTDSAIVFQRRIIINDMPERL